MTERKDISRWVNRDLENAIAFLNMLRSTPEVLDAIEEKVAERIRLHEEEKKLKGEEVENG